jgi:uncharacterized membrane protein YhiD involved in acid resistance
MESLLLNFGSVRLEWHAIVLSLLLAFLCSGAIAFVYERTFVGLSWSRGLLQTMVLGSMVASLLMIAIGDNVARGIGIVGSLAIVRFRTNLRDARDLIFVFASMGVGVACGVQSYVAAIVGTFLFSLAALTLNATRFGHRTAHDGLVRLQIPAGAAASSQVVKAMGSITMHFALVTLRPAAQGDLVDYSYQVKLARAGEHERLLAELEKIPGILGLTYVNQQTTVEL